MGINLSPAITGSFADWINTSGSAGGGGAAGGAGDGQTVFQIQAQPAPGALEYSIEIDGQQLRYRNTQSQWTNFIWPNPQGAPGARVTAVTYDGRTVELANQPGRFGLERLINSAQRKRRDNGIFELSWTSEGVTVAVNLKIIRARRSPAAAMDLPVEQQRCVA